MNEFQPQESRNACLDRGLLVSLRDGELTPDETERALAHLAICPDCTVDQRSLETGSRQLYDVLDTLDPSGADLPETAAAFASLQSRLSGESRRERRLGAATASPVTTVHRLKAARPKRLQRWWVGAAAAIVVAVVLLPHADALANQFLGLFQPQSFQPVSVDLETFRNGIGENLQNFGEISFNDANLKSISHPTEAELQQDLNFKLLLPGHLPSGVGQAMQFSLIDGSSATFTFNAAHARAYLQQTSQSSVSIPPELDGATFTITLASGVIVNYGKVCQSETQIVNWSNPDANGSLPGTVHSSQAAPGSSPAPSGADQNGNGLTPGVADLGCSGGKPFYVGELPSPVIRATGKASLQDLQSFILSLPKLSASARLLLQDVNLSTGVVPLPIPSQLQAEQVTTHNARGVMVVDPSLSLGAVVWQTGGVVYMVAGATSNSTQLMDSANSLH